MGGCVGVTLRYPDGTIKKMNRWTNTLPWFILNHKLITKDLKHVAEWMRAHEEMEQDYLLNKESKKYKLPMTSSYFPFDMLAPVEYGLVVVDMLNSKLYSAQGYTSFTHLNAFMAESDYKKAEELFKGKHITKVKIREAIRETSTDVWDWKNQKESVKKIKNLQDFKSIIKKDASKYGPNQLNALEETWYTFLINWGSWKLSIFKDDVQGFKDLRNTLIIDGWQLTPKEEIEWDQFISERDR